MIITADELRGALDGGEAIVVLDARQHYTDADAPRRMWVEARIPGAAHLDMATAIAAPRRPDGIGGRNPLPTPRAFLDGLTRAGARTDTRIVVYDERMEGVAARVWWLARELDIEIAVLEGGLAAWLAAGGTIASGEPDARPEAGDLVLPAGVDPDITIGEDGRRTVTATALLGPVPGLLLLDVRGATRYRGEEEPLDPVGGHIPGAVNIPNVDEHGEATSPAVLAGLVAHDGEVVVSCGSGVSACIMLLRLAAAGRDDAKLYPGSWSEWLALGLPYATGDSPR